MRGNVDRESVHLMSPRGIDRIVESAVILFTYSQIPTASSLARHSHQEAIPSQSWKHEIQGNQRNDFRKCPRTCRRRHSTRSDFVEFACMLLLESY